MADCPLTIDQLADDYWRELTDREWTTAAALLAKAWPMLLDQSPGLTDRLTAGTVSDEAAQIVLEQAVGRVIENPRGLRQGSRTLENEYSESWTVDHAVSTGALYFTDAELRQVAGATARGRRGKAFGIDTAPAPTYPLDACW